MSATSAVSRPGQQISIDGESRVVKSVGSAATGADDGLHPGIDRPWLTVPAGSTNIPVMNAAGFAVGQKIGIDAGGHHEIVTVTAVGKAGTQSTLAGGGRPRARR